MPARVGLFKRKQGGGATAAAVASTDLRDRPSLRLGPPARPQGRPQQELISGATGRGSAANLDYLPGSRACGRHRLVHHGEPRTSQVGDPAFGTSEKKAVRMKNLPTFAGLLQSFFTERLMGHRNASPQTIASYRDTFRLLLALVQDRQHGRANSGVSGGPGGIPAGI
jgi:hypothetical protein